MRISAKCKIKSCGVLRRKIGRKKHVKIKKKVSKKIPRLWQKVVILLKIILRTVEEEYDFEAPRIHSDLLKTAIINFSQPI